MVRRAAQTKSWVAGSRESSSRRFRSWGTAPKRCSPVSMPERARLVAARSRTCFAVVGQNRKKRIDGLCGAQHSQSLDGPEASLLIRIARITQESGQNCGRLDPAIAEGTESP